MDDLIKKASLANQNGFKFYKNFKISWQPGVIWPTFNLEDDYNRQEIKYKTTKEKMTTRPKRNSLAEKMLKYNGVEKIETKGDSSKDLRLVDNSAFVFCETYMKNFLIPRIISNTLLSQVCKFRSKGRLPILCFVYRGIKSKLIIFTNIRWGTNTSLSLERVTAKIRNFKSSEL